MNQEELIQYINELFERYEKQFKEIEDKMKKLKEKETPRQLNYNTCVCGNHTELDWDYCTKCGQRITHYIF